MPRFEFKTQKTMLQPETIEADHYDLDMKGEKLTFYDEDDEQIASYHVHPGAYVKRLAP